MKCAAPDWASDANQLLVRPERATRYNPWPTMTLRRKMTLQNAAMLTGLLLVSAAALWGLNGLHHQSGLEREGNARLQQVYQVGSHLATAQKMLIMPHPQMLRFARDEVHSAATALDALPPPGGTWDASADRDVREGMRRVVEIADHPPDEPDAVYAEAVRDAINDEMAQVPRLVSGIRHAVELSQQSAEQRLQTTIATVALLCGIVVIGGAIVGVLQYRGVVRPLRRLGAAAHQIAAGQFENRVEPSGGDELITLARDFNRMASELDGLYRDLERKVADKSRELVRSERLASVGYLAAGVAHEINNPLGIISGYAEYSLSVIRARTSAGNDAQGPGGNLAAAKDEEIEKSLRVICDEAFRCKEITKKLLSLVRGGGGAEGADGDRQAVSMAALVEQVLALVERLDTFREHRVILTADEGAMVQVLAVETEMKQVLLNLVINALEAIAGAPDAEVRIDVARREEWVDVTVEDNGRGMSAQTLERVFEPFYTEKRGRPDGAAAHGTGLGLSISHAIVESHGGRITAHSEGLGKGSRFVITLPAVVSPVTSGGE